MKGITIKFPEAALRRLRLEAREAGRTIAGLVRERVERTARPDAAASVHSVTADLAGSLAGRRRSATNARRRFRRP